MSGLSQAEAKIVASVLATLREDVPIDAKMPCDVTVCMPVYNSIFTVQKALRSTWFGRQSTPVNMFICENGSTDGTQDLLRGLRDPSVTRDWWLGRSKWRNLVVFEQPQEESLNGRFPREYFNIRACFSHMFKHVKTKYILTLDGDVDLPAGIIRTLLECMERDEKLGIVGVLYDLQASHVKHGLSLMTTANARRWVERLQINECMCAQWCRMAEDDGLKCVNLPGITARHRKNEQD
jgi:glycosyltransferase involved in cell wall biosynthesis